MYGSLRILKLQPRFKVCNISYLRLLTNLLYYDYKCLCFINLLTGHYKIYGALIQGIMEKVVNYEKQWPPNFNMSFVSFVFNLNIVIFLEIDNSGLSENQDSNAICLYSLISFVTILRKMFNLPVVTTVSVSAGRIHHLKREILHVTLTIMPTLQTYILIKF